MKTHRIFASVAVATLLLAMTPAGAASLEIGGSGGLVSLGSGDGSSSGSDTSVDVDGDAGVHLDLLDGGGDGDAAPDLFGSGKQLVDTGGDNLVTVDTGDDADALVTLFGSPGGELLEDQAVDVDLLEADREDEVFVRLFGTGASDTSAVVDLGGGEDAGAFGPDAAAIELFGASSDDFGGADDGTGVDDTQTGSVAASEGAGAGGGIAANPASQRLAPARAGARVATTGGGSARNGCFSPNQTQIAHLLGRSEYEPGDVAGWREAERVSVVPVKLCADAKVRLDTALDAHADIEYLREAVAEVATLSNELSPSYAADDVLAVDQSGEEVTVYVY